MRMHTNVLRRVKEDRMIYNKCCLIILTGLLMNTRRIKGQLAINVPAVGNYGEETQMNCTEANFTIANGYIWRKDNIIIYDNVNGDATSTGKYTSTHGTGFFTLTVKNTAPGDAGVYVCDYNFGLQSGTLAIQAKGTVTAELSSSSSGKLEVTFHKIYPSPSAVVITCDSIIETGDFVSNETDGDIFNIKWVSDKNFTSVPDKCSVNMTLVTAFSVAFDVTSATPPTSDVSSTSTPTTAPTTTPPATSTTTPSTQIPTSTTSTNSDSSSNSTNTSSAVVPNPATTPSSTVIIISSVVGGLFFVGIVITIVLMLLSQRKKHHPSVKHSRHHRHHDQDRRQKRPYNQEYPTWQDHGRYNNASYMEYTGMGTKMNPLYVPNRSAYRAEQNYSLGHPSADHQSYIRNHHLYYNSNIRPQTSMHSYQQRYYGERGDNNMIRSGLRKDENNYVTPDYELY